MRRVLTRAEPVDHGDGLFTDHAAREAQDVRMTVGKSRRPSGAPNVLCFVDCIPVPSVINRPVVNLSTSR
jgi:hypothetical protein